MLLNFCLLLFLFGTKFTYGFTTCLNSELFLKRLPSRCQIYVVQKTVPKQVRHWFMYDVNGTLPFQNYFWVCSGSTYLLSAWGRLSMKISDNWWSLKAKNIELQLTQFLDAGPMYVCRKKTPWPQDYVNWYVREY
jgi:hypothetical protein